MAEVVCGADRCSYRNSSGFCTRQYIMLNQGAACTQFYLNNGQPRMQQWDLTRIIEELSEDEEGETNE